MAKKKPIELPKSWLSRPRMERIRILEEVRYIHGHSLDALERDVDLCLREARQKLNTDDALHPVICSPMIETDKWFVQRVEFYREYYRERKF